MYNSEVSDRYTIASQLQRMVNEEFPNKFRVINYGATSINSMQQFERLKTVKIDKGDIIVFYGGVNDCHIFRTRSSEGWIMGENRKDIEKIGFFLKLWMKVYYEFKSTSKFVEVFLSPYSRRIPSYLKDKNIVEELQVELQRSYERTIVKADSISNINDAKFYNFVQPHILTKDKNTSYETEIITNKFLTHDLWLHSLELGYEILIQCNQGLVSRGIKSKDITGVFDLSESELYLDMCHVNEEANHLIARELFSTIF